MADQKYEYHVVGLLTLDSKLPGMSGVRVELNKRAAKGWRLVEAYQGRTGLTPRQVLIFERAID